METDRDLYEVLCRIDAGEVFSDEIMEKIGNWKEIESIFYDFDLSKGKIPNCIGLVKSVTNLDLSSTQVEDISTLSGLTALRSLDLSGTSVRDISVLSGLTSLTNLDLCRTQIKNISALSGLTALINLDLSETDVSDISALSGLTALTNLDLSETDVSDISALSGLTALTNLDLTGTQVKDISALSGLTALTNLDLRYTKVEDISALSGLTSLTNLDLSWSKVSDISALSGLTALTNLDLRTLTLTELPEFLLDLNIPFIDSEDFFVKKGINIHNLKLKNQDISIFLSNDRTLIREYYRTQKAAQASPLNEVKVVFLGDGQAGKSLTIERLLHDGKMPENFNGEATPGISINTKTYGIGKDDIVVHFWDFGGQEIMHSMHRLFLTQRTLYVVFLNARDNKQDDQAWYWLNNIRSFAKDAPALIILNQMDQNPSAALNVSGLKNFYPALSENILKISALNDSPEVFNAQVTESIKKEIDGMASVRVSFPNEWKRLMEDIRGMEVDYIQAETFREKCARQGIAYEKDLFDRIINLFQDTGVCFCSRKNAFQGDYMVLKPDWLTNALYIIAFNGRRYAKNGILTENDCYKLFEEEPAGEEAVKKVRKDFKYKNADIRYILDVVQNFGLLYQIDKERFFMPLLCDPDEGTIEKQFLAGGEALHTSFVYTYLPANVLHQLMVHFGKDLDMAKVWRTGAVFNRHECGWQALVCIRQNRLEMYVRGKNEDMYPGAAYREMLSRAVSEINDDYGFKAEELVYYRWQGEEEAFKLKTIKRIIEKGRDEIFSELRDEYIRVREILSAYTIKPEVLEQEILRERLCDALLTLQANTDYLKEKGYNTRVRDLLKSGYICKDETEEGVSESRIESGELDILIQDKKTSRDLAIYEGLRLTSFGDEAKDYLNRHLNKLVDNYNIKGLPYLYLVSYVSWSKEKFGTLAGKYYEHVVGGAGAKNPVSRSRTLSAGPGQYMRCWEVSYQCGGTPFTVFHIVVRMGK